MICIQFLPQILLLFPLLKLQALQQLQKSSRYAFFNPAPLMKLVEIVYHSSTDEDIINTLAALTKQFGKTPVVCRDAPGFIVKQSCPPLLSGSYAAC